MPIPGANYSMMVDGKPIIEPPEKATPPGQDDAAYKAWAKTNARIPDATVADWVKVIRDPSVDFNWRTRLRGIATEQLAKVGRAFEEPMPVMESKKET